jgi:hypothetical protein
MTLLESIHEAAPQGKPAVAQLLQEAGLDFHINKSSELKHRLKRHPKDNIFKKCIAVAAEWAGFVDDASWMADALRYFASQTPIIKNKYRPGFHRANPIAYLDTWYEVLGDFRVPSPPDGKSSAKEVIKFFQDSFTVLKQLDWRKERHWVGPWTFLGAFKLYLIHEDRLWSDPGIDAITMPMGGESEGYSFERGWKALESLNLVSPLASTHSFADGMAKAAQAHSEVVQLAALAKTRALHINSGIYLLGSA